MAKSRRPRFTLVGHRGREVSSNQVYESCPVCSTDVLNTEEHLTETGCTRCDYLRAKKNAK